MSSIFVTRLNDAWSDACIAKILAMSGLQVAEHDLVQKLLADFVHDRKLGLLWSTSVRPDHATSQLLRVWSDDFGARAEISAFKSIGEARRRLADQSGSRRIWRSIPRGLVRRGALLQDQLYHRKWQQPQGWAGQESRNQLGKFDRGAFVWLDPQHLLWSAEFRELAPEGNWSFIEDRVNPPSRAYLKLWEWSWRSDFRPKSGDRVLDLGASPGGWTWVLLEAGCRVVTLDRTSELHPAVRERIESAHQGDAFDLSSWPEGNWDWVTCDVIAAPERSLRLIEELRERNQRFVITVKFKGVPEDRDIERLLHQLDDRRVRAQRLWHNKHEITVWMDRT
ncbi:MAG TPA: SAM-dependent methyltransferase [Pseudobdellovibrionaceae bacterium]|nr:SAM-dependent methyltransferase [Pseudobdellovibrionaceae bacterium]